RRDAVDAERVVFDAREARLGYGVELLDDGGDRGGIGRWLDCWIGRVGRGIGRLWIGWLALNRRAAAATATAVVLIEQGFGRSALDDAIGYRVSMLFVRIA